MDSTIHAKIESALRQVTFSLEYAARRRAEIRRIADVIAHGAEDDSPPPDEDLLSDAEIDHAFGVGVACRYARSASDDLDVEGAT